MANEPGTNWARTAWVWTMFTIICLNHINLKYVSGRHDFHPALFIILYSHCQTYFSWSYAGTCAVHMQYFDISLLTPISHHDSTQFFSRLILFCTAEVSFSRVDRCPLGICRCEGCLGSMSGKLSNPCFKSDMIIIIPSSSKR